MSHNRVDLCPYSKKSLKCSYPNKCSLNNSQFISKVKLWLFYPRLKTITWDKVRQKGGFSKRNVFFGIWVCIPAQIKRPYRVIKWFYNYFRVDGPINRIMTEELCKDLKLCEAEYNRLLWDGQ